MFLIALSSLHLFEILKNFLFHQFKFGYDKTMILALLPWMRQSKFWCPSFLQPQASLLVFQPSGKRDGAKESDQEGKAREKDRVRGQRNTPLSLFLSFTFPLFFPLLSTLGSSPLGTFVTWNVINWSILRAKNKNWKLITTFNFELFSKFMITSS